MLSHLDTSVCTRNGASLPKITRESASSKRGGLGRESEIELDLFALSFSGLCFTRRTWYGMSLCSDQTTGTWRLGRLELAPHGDPET